jgi:lincosamide nucleotidyltransferase A/C/D/E
MIGPSEVIEVLEALGAAEIPVWLDGGWGIDALVGEQTRAHDDLDLVVARTDCARAQDALAPPGFAHAPEIEPGLPARLVLRGSNDRGVDLHPVLLDAVGNGWQELPTGGWGLYPAEGLEGHGQVGGRPVACLTPDTTSATGSTRPTGTTWRRWPAVTTWHCHLGWARQSSGEPHTGTVGCPNSWAPCHLFRILVGL